MKFSIIETGLGGLRDATNCLKSDLSVFTPIEEEHKDIIGPSLKDIIKEKLGIIRENSKVLVSPYNLSRNFDVFNKEINFKKAKLLPFKEFNVRNFKPSYQKENFILALNSVSAFYPINEKEIIVNNKTIPSRFEKIKFKNKNIFLDGAHTKNSFLKILNEENFDCIVLSFMKDKNIKEIIKVIKEKKSFIIFTKTNSYRTINPEEIVDKYEIKNKFLILKNPKNAFNYAIKNYNKILISGSLYLCAQIKSYLNNKKIYFPREMIKK